MTDHVQIARLKSPVGRIELVAVGDSLTSLTIERDGALPHDGLPETSSALLQEAKEQLTQYFSGERREFDLPLSLIGTPFQRAVWDGLRSLHWGDHTSYSALASSVGRPLASRAIGGAVGANPIPIIIGCHRVLATNGRITGYSGGSGVPTKVWLLDHERIRFAA